MTYNFDCISPKLRSIIEPATLKSHRFEKKLGHKIYENAFVAPFHLWEESIGCVIDGSGKAVKDPVCWEWKENEAYYQLDCAARECKNVVYLGCIVTVFGHSFTDDLQKLWFLGTNECKELEANGWGLVYTTSQNLPLPAFVVDIFKLAGYDVSKARRITELVRFDRVCIPDNSITACEYGRRYCAEYEMAINQIKANVPLGVLRHEKLYFSRSKFTKGSKKEFGEEAIERVFRKKGYTVVEPEDYSILEQIQMVQNCDCFAATEGSVAHLSLFCKPGTQVTIVNKANYLNFHQLMINEYADLNVTYVEAHHSVKAHLTRPWRGPFYLCINKYLERYVGHPILHLPYWLLPSYWEYTRNMLYRGINKVRKATELGK